MRGARARCTSAAAFGPVGTERAPLPSILRPPDTGSSPLNCHSKLLQPEQLPPCTSMIYATYTQNRPLACRPLSPCGCSGLAATVAHPEPWWAMSATRPLSAMQGAAGTAAKVARSQTGVGGQLRDYWGRSAFRMPHRAGGAKHIPQPGLPGIPSAVPPAAAQGHEYGAAARPQGPNFTK